MRRVTLEARQMGTRTALHDCLARQLHFPPWYGRNLDALYDLLSTESEDITLVIENRAALDSWEYGRAFLRTLEDAAAVNPRLHWEESLPPSV